MNIYDADSAERDWQREQTAEARYLRDTYSDRQADLAETGCTPQEIEMRPPMQSSLFPELERKQPVLITRPKEARRG